jgi:hypothetical protein
MAQKEKPSRSSRLFERVIQTCGDPASGHHALGSPLRCCATAGHIRQPCWLHGHDRRKRSALRHWRPKRRDLYAGPNRALVRQPLRTSATAVAAKAAMAAKTTTMEAAKATAMHVGEA